MQTKAQTAMEKIGEGDLSSWKGDFDQSLTGLDTAVKTTDAEFADSVQELQTSYKEATERSAALNEAADEHAKETEDSEDDSGYDEDDDNEPPETDDIPPVEEL
jgi:methyl-accepting chemotaxis protein